MKYALVTGASKGIGRAISWELAKRKNNLILVARSGELLDTLAKEIQEKHGVVVICQPRDLTNLTSAQELAGLCTSNKYEVNILVNNAGFGLWGAFGQLPIEGQLEMMNLNMSSLVSLTHHFLPVLSQSGQSYILNVGSLASFLAIPHFSIYAATKAFVLSFSRSLRFDIADKGIKVSCLCPGATESEFLKVAGMEAVGKKAASIYMSAEEVAETAVSGMMRGKAEIVPGIVNKIATKGIRITPRTISETIAGIFYRGRETK